MIDWNRSRAISLAIAIGVVVIILVRHGGVTAKVIRASVFLSVPVLCIWFPEIICRRQSYDGRRLDTETPAIMISIAGWILLLTCVWATLRN